MFNPSSSVCIAISLCMLLTTSELVHANEVIYDAGAVSNLVKVRQDDTPALEKLIRVEAARNEIEPFQIVLRAGEPLRGVKISFSDLNGPSGRIGADHVEAFIEHYHRVDKVGSDMRIFPAGEAASTIGQLWPDALVPYKPFEVERGNQGLWIQLRVPADAAAGSYHGTLTISPENAIAQELRIELTVWDFTLPITPSFRMMGAVQLGTDPFAAGEPGSDAWKKQWKQRTLWFLDQGISPCWLVSDDATPSNWSPFPHRPFTESLAEYLDHPNCTTVQMSHYDLDWRDPSRHAAMQKSTDWVKKRWGNKIATIIRTGDEPPADTYPELRQDGITVHKIHPNLKVLLTARDISPALEDGVDYWCPFFTEIGNHIQLDTIRRRREKGEEVWFYANDFTFPVDIQAVHHRVVGWAAARYGIQGEYLFGINWWLTEQGYSDPFKTLMSGANGWNGGSWLAWPGESPGGSGLFSSIRLAQIRQWMEDYEYFELLKSRITRVQKTLGFEDRWLADDRAWEIAGTVISDAYHYNPSPDNLVEVRRELAAEIIETEQSPLIVLTMVPRSGAVTDLDKLSIRGAVESGARLQANGKDFAVDGTGRFEITLPLVEGDNTVTITATLGDRSKVLKRRVVYRPDETLIKAIRDSIEEANSQGVEIPSRLPATIEYYRLNGGWGDHRRRDEAKRLFETLQLNRYRTLLEKVRNQSLADDIKRSFIDIAEARAQSNQFSEAAHMLSEGLKVQAVGPCSVKPIRYEDYFGWQLDNGSVRVVVLEQGARIMSMRVGDVPLLLRGMVRPLDLGDVSWRDIGGYEDVISDRMDASVSQEPWAIEIVRATANEVTLRATKAMTDQFGQNLRVVRNMTLLKNSSSLRINYEIHNLGKQEAKVSWRAHISPAVGVNPHNEGGDPEGDQFVLSDPAVQAGLKFKSFDSKAHPGLATDMNVKIDRGFISAFDPAVRTALVVTVGEKTPYAYLWYETNDLRPYENPWRSTRNRYTFEPNNSLGQPSLSHVIPRMGVAKFEMSLSGLKDIDSAAELRERAQNLP